MTDYETLQAVVGQLLDGHPRQAVLSWNSAGCQPPLKALRLSDDGEDVLLALQTGETVRVPLDAALASLDSEVLREV